MADTLAKSSALEQAFGKLGLPRSIYVELIGLYTGPGRHYHNEKHLLHCLREYGEAPVERQRSVELALWFHDAIYDPTRMDNEVRSANLARERLSGTLLTASEVMEITRLVLATVHKTPPEKADEQLIADIDLAILGQPAEIFDEYERGIRREYGHIAESEFRKGRAKVLRRILSWPFIYSTARFRTLYEHAARQNLARSLASLEH